MVKKFCPHCKNLLEQLRACGCQDWFCQHCGVLVSRKQALSVSAEYSEQELNLSATAAANLSDNGE
ncbi:zinc-ribbon domain-containing protein [Gynuella sp.]|uniref:YfgJ family double zinc ribbon protein n=1 Tax=Gynuella sp. TaxID=2969146 RepID=UPI003D0E7657